MNVRRYCCGLTPRAREKWWRSAAALPKPDLAGDPVDRVVGELEELLGGLHPLRGHPAVRRGAGLGPEPAGEGARRHVAAPRELLDAEVLAEVLGDPGEQRAEGLGVAVGYGARDELRLPAERCGGTTIRRAAAAATRAPNCWRIRCSDASSPAAEPAPVTIVPSWT